MSVWSTVKLKFVQPVTGGFSVKNWLEDAGAEFIVRNQLRQHIDKHNVRQDIEFVFSDGGISAAQLIDRLIKAIQAVPGAEIWNADANIRF